VNMAMSPYTPATLLRSFAGFRVLEDDQRACSPQNKEPIGLLRKMSCGRRKAGIGGSPVLRSRSETKDRSGRGRGLHSCLRVSFIAGARIEFRVALSLSS
jgi:hypothetical protein